MVDVVRHLYHYLCRITQARVVGRQRLGTFEPPACLGMTGLWKVVRSASWHFVFGIRMDPKSPIHQFAVSRRVSMNVLQTHNTYQALWIVSWDSNIFCSLSWTLHDTRLWRSRPQTHSLCVVQSWVFIKWGRYLIKPLSTSSMWRSCLKVKYIKTLSA